MDSAYETQITEKKSADPAASANVGAAHRHGTSLTIGERKMKLGHIIDAIIFGALGTSFLLMSFGKMRVSKDAEANALWRKKWGPFMGIAGAVLLGTGIYHAARLL